MTYNVFGETFNLSQLQLCGSLNYQCDIMQSKMTVFFSDTLKFSWICRYLEVMNYT